MNMMLLFASLAAILAVAGLVWLLQLGENRIAMPPTLRASPKSRSRASNPGRC